VCLFMNSLGNFVRAGAMAVGLVGAVAGCGVTEQEVCEENDGVWKRWGLLPEESCNLRTSDDGMDCYDSSECEGSCISYGACSGEECNDLVGSCSDFETEYGCFVLVRYDGTREICVD